MKALMIPLSSKHDALQDIVCKKHQNVTNPLHYFICDGSGKIALTGDSNNGYFSINIESLSPGVYILKLYNAYTINASTTKVVVK